MDKSSEIYNENILDSIDIILGYAHFRNWNPDWVVFRDIFNMFPNSYSVLTPFAYSYLEEVIRSTTSQYGKEIVDSEGNDIYRYSGKKLLKLAKTENENNRELIEKNFEKLETIEQRLYELR